MRAAAFVPRHRRAKSRLAVSAHWEIIEGLAAVREEAARSRPRRSHRLPRRAEAGMLGRPRRHWHASPSGTSSRGGSSPIRIGAERAGLCAPTYNRGHLRIAGRALRGTEKIRDGIPSASNAHPRSTGIPSRVRERSEGIQPAASLQYPVHPRSARHASAHRWAVAQAPRRLASSCSRPTERATRRLAFECSIQNALAGRCAVQTQMIALVSPPSSMDAQVFFSSATQTERKDMT